MYNIQCTISKIDRSNASMHITLTNTGKRYNREWIFRHLDYEFLPGKTYAITGPNGSGKSTLLQVIAGAVMQSEGSVEYKKLPMRDPGSEIGDSALQHPDPVSPIPHSASRIQDPVSSIPYPVSRIPSLLSYAAPYMELIEEMTATELLQFHSTFKKLIKPIAVILAEINLEKTAHKQIRYFSSGMKQRLKLAQAFFSDTPVLLLDEPLTNLDDEGIKLYHRLISNTAKEKMIIISSNDKQEYDFCEEVIGIGNYK